MEQCMDSENLHRHLKRIIGQVQATNRMVDEDIPCESVLAQVNATESALHKMGQVVLEGHTKYCMRDGIEHGDMGQAIASFTKVVECFINMIQARTKDTTHAQGQRKIRLISQNRYEPVPRLDSYIPPEQELCIISPVAWRQIPAVFFPLWMNLMIGRKESR